MRRSPYATNTSAGVRGPYLLTVGAALAQCTTRPVVLPSALVAPLASPTASSPVRAPAPTRQRTPPASPRRSWPTAPGVELALAPPFEDEQQRDADLCPNEQE